MPHLDTIVNTKRNVLQNLKEYSYLIMLDFMKKKYTCISNPLHFDIFSDLVISGWRITWFWFWYAAHKNGCSFVYVEVNYLLFFNRFFSLQHLPHRISPILTSFLKFEFSSVQITSSFIVNIPCFILFLQYPSYKSLLGHKCIARTWLMWTRNWCIVQQLKNIQTWKLES